MTENISTYKTIIVLSEDSCIRWAAKELKRILCVIDGLERLISSSVPKTGNYFLISDVKDIKTISAPLEIKSRIKSLHNDGYIIAPLKGKIIMAGKIAKGAANAVFAFLESLGVRWIMPGKNGEIIPKEPIHLPEKMVFSEPDFAYRGVIGAIKSIEYFEFLAHNKINSFLWHGTDENFIKNVLKYGLRLEIGGHGLSSLLPRDLFQTKKECFRMNQPEDFSGVRTKDFNLCPTSALSHRILERNVVKVVKRWPEAWGYHFWPDDLSGGNWCFCSRCRALNESDQALLITNTIAKAISKVYPGRKTAFVSYHDTLVTPGTVEPIPEIFLLFAPRERCYAHAIDDSSCSRNAFYRSSLEAMMQKFRGNTETHLVEYYSDQILFRGLYPLLPEVISRDLKYYKKIGAPVIFNLHVGGPWVTPPLTMLYYLQASWNVEASAAKFFQKTAQILGKKEEKTLNTYYRNWEKASKRAFLFCGYPQERYIDYRWLPENPGTFCLQHWREIKKSSAALSSFPEKLNKAAQSTSDAISRRILSQEANLSTFHTAELKAMAEQVRAMYFLGNFWRQGKIKDLKKGIVHLKGAYSSLRNNRKIARNLGMPKSSYYWWINNWLQDEFRRKITTLRKFLK